MKHTLTLDKLIFILFFLACAVALPAQNYTVSGGSGTPLLALEKKPMLVYLLNGLNGAQITYTSSDAGTIQWYKYKDKAANAVPIPRTQAGNTSTVTGIESDCGYFVGNPLSSDTWYVWIVDYSKYVPEFNSLTIDDSGDDICENLKFIADVGAEPIYYYAGTGSRNELDREYELSYDALEYNETDKVFYNYQAQNILKYKVSRFEFTIPAPLKNTDFKLSGDAYADYFGLGKSLKTGIYDAVAIKADIDTTIIQSESDNINKTKQGTSAPMSMTLRAIANEPVASFYVWKIMQKPKSGAWEQIVRFPNQEFSYTFDRSGKYQVILEVSGQNPVCMDSLSFDVDISESVLEAPNYFSPDDSPGVNDIYKVSYKSLVKFSAWIFSQWGNQLFHWTNPDEGWDGMVRGKVVPSGVYYIVIEAEGSDGHSYKIKKAINVLHTKNK